MSKDDGGPAFPLKNYTSEIGPDNCGFMAKDVTGHSFWVNSGSPGMSLRDWFAGRALSYLPMVIVKGLRQTSGEDPVTTRKWDNSEQMAQLAYDLADDMLAVRDKNND